jgi:hypothetical protein
MSMQRPGVWLRGFLVVGLAAAAQAGESAGADLVAILRARLAEQQQRLDELQATVAEQDPSVARRRASDLREQIRAILNEPGFREGLLEPALQAGYDGAFFIRSSDEQFSLRTNGYLQFRYTYYQAGWANRYLLPGFRRPDRNGFDVRRVRWIIRGDLYRRTVSWYLQLRSDGPDNYRTRIRDAFVNFRIAEALQFRAGIFKVAATQTRITSASRLQFVERPLFDSLFGYNRGTGIRLWGRALDRRLEYHLDVVNSLGSDGNRTITPDPPALDGNPGIAARVVWFLLGDDAADTLKAEAALEDHTEPAWDIAFHYAFNEDAGDRRSADAPFPVTRARPTIGAFGVTSTRGLQTNQFGLSSRFKYRRLSLRGEYIVRLVDPRNTDYRPLTPWYQLTGADATTAQHGGYVQVGWFPPIPRLEEKLELVARVGGYAFHASAHDDAWEYALGVNYYFAGNRVKLQADVTKVTEAPVSSPGSSVANVNDGPLVFRVQLQAGF